jgi:hypothetical protein
MRLVCYTQGVMESDGLLSEKRLAAQPARERVQYKSKLLYSKGNVKCGGVWFW